MIVRESNGIRSVRVFFFALVALFAFSTCSNITNMDPASDATPDAGIDPVTLTSAPIVELPEGYSGEGVVGIEPSTRTAPGRIGSHFMPVGPVWDITLDGQEHVSFEDDPAVLRFEYDPSKLSGADVLEEFVVFVFDEVENDWKRVEVTVPVEDGDIHYVQAETSHFSSFVATAATTGSGSVSVVPDMDAIFPDGIGGSGGARFALIDESFRYYLDRDYYLLPAGTGPGESVVNQRTFDALGLDGSVGIATYNGGSAEQPFSAHKHFSGTLYIDFVAHMDLDLYLLYDTRGGTGPEDTSKDASWLTYFAWADLEAIEDDEGPFYLETTDPVGLYRVYKGSYDYGERIRLNGNWRGVTDTASIQTNYWAILKPRGSTASGTAGGVSELVSVSGISLPDGPIQMSQIDETRTLTLEPTLHPANATDRTIYWTTSDYTIVNVTRTTDSRSPRLTAVNSGSVQITALTKDGGYSATVEVVVVSSPDSDGDTVPDANEGIMDPGGDADADGIPDYLDVDDDGDGITTEVERQLVIELHPLSFIDDLDGDGVPDFYDGDSDGDGILDSIEAHDANSDGVADRVASGIDTDGNGLDDAFDPDDGGVPAPLQDTDGDGVPDYLDPDS